MRKDGKRDMYVMPEYKREGTSVIETLANPRYERPMRRGVSGTNGEVEEVFHKISTKVEGGWRWKSMKNF